MLTVLASLIRNVGIRRVYPRGMDLSSTTRFTVRQREKDGKASSAQSGVRPVLRGIREYSELFLDILGNRQFRQFSPTLHTGPPKPVRNVENIRLTQGLKRCVLSRKDPLQALCDGEY